MFSQINEFAKIRKTARAYLCYLLHRNIPHRLPNITYELVELGLSKVLNEIKDADVAYILDASGKQIENNLSKNNKYILEKAENRGSRGYFYRAVKEKKCVLTDPYPSTLTGELCVSASMPIYDEKGELQFVAVIDLSLENIVKTVHLQKGDNLFQNVSKFVYAGFSAALFLVAMVLFFNGIKSFFNIGIHNLHVEEMFTSTILLTLSLAIFDLVKTIFQEEVIGDHDESQPTHIHKTMIKFLGSIIIAIAIEALMLVFKFALTAPDRLVFAAYLIGGVTALIIGLAYYLKSVHQCQVGDNK
jgi:uncharacterized membrane-anchored protein